MKIEFNPGKIRESKFSEALVRFCFGGAITAITGIIDKKFGPGVAGLFLAFPAILPASITLVESHKAKNEGGKENEAKNEAGEDSMGASFGSVGLAAFGVAVFLLAQQLGIVGSLVVAFLIWLAVGVAVWYGFEVFSGRASRAEAAATANRGRKTRAPRKRAAT